MLIFLHLNFLVKCIDLHSTIVCAINEPCIIIVIIIIIIISIIIVIVIISTITIIIIIIIILYSIGTLTSKHAGQMYLYV